MEEELHYSTVVFKNGGPAPKEINKEETVYADVKAKEHAADKSTTVPTDGEAAAHTQHFHLLAACLGIICVLLVAAIIPSIIYFNMVISEQKANLNNLTTQNLQLRTERTSLERQTEELSREKDSLNWTLGVIFEFDNFPVNKYCSQKAECKPCRDGWIMFQQSCYFFFQGNAREWESWESSRQSCQKMAADLVVVGSLQEQEFISNHTEFYYDEYHGYWIGLRETENNWLWVDGSNQTLGYWVTEHLGQSGHCTLTIPQRAPVASWTKAGCTMRNKWICEAKVLFKSD
uniref:C-type lectin domain family 7 member A-like n=1 Tax=Centroberyx gerrardi TaxID=166262 RepID=UPI003AAC4917